MDGSVSGENIFLLYSLGMGVFITFVYDLLRILRRVCAHNAFFISLEDLLFWVFCALGVFYMMYALSNGTLRWFSVFGALAGMLLYRKTLSPFFVKWVSKALSGLIRLAARLFKVLGKPFFLAGRGIKRTGIQAKKGGLRAGRHLKKKLTMFLKTLKITVCKH